MAISKVAICNQALANLGKRSIAALDGSDESARQCERFYDTTRDAVLRDYPWSFAKRQVALALLSNESVIGWDYVYAYPSDCVRVCKVFTEGSYDPFGGEEFEEFNVGGALCVVCDLSEAYAEYTMRIIDVTLFDAQFIKALGFALATDLAVPLTGDAAKRNDMLKLYQSVLPIAKVSAATERNKKSQFSTRYTGGRW